MVGKAKEGVGLALIRHQNQRSHQPNRHAKNANRPLESVTDISNLDEVMDQAELAGHVFSTLNPLPHLLLTQDTTESSDHRKQQQKIEEALFSSYLKIPRRPRWHVGITPQELDAKERHEFLNWRRSLVRLEDLEKLVITPFEKNIDIWRQLWRVLERSDLVVMVVDARNPLFYRCPDLEDYIKEIDNNKRTMLLLNKADLLPHDARLEWARYLRSQNISFVFWSAKLATGKADDNFDRSTNLQMRSDLNERHSEDQLDEDIRILDREELLDRLQCEAEQVSEIRTMASVASRRSDWNENDMPRKTNDEDVKSVCSNSGAGLVSRPVTHAVVGFVGYPNVGKSSTINALVGEKRTGVTSTPGKTKHFQTLVISDKLTLCDCPGLVFPSFSYSRSDMVALGVLPIDKMTDQRGPIQVVAEQVARARLEEVYGIRLPKPKPYEPQDRPPSAAELLITLARARGYVSSSGLADETRAARLIMKDYVNGKLLHYQLPPNTDNAALGQSDATQLSLPGDVGSYSNLTLMQGVVAPVDSSKDDICVERIKIDESVTERECSQIGITMCSISYERTGSLLGAAFTKNSEEDVISSVEKVPSVGEAHASADKEHFVSADTRRSDDDSGPIADRKNSNSNMSSVLDDLATFDLMNGLNATKSANKNQTSVKTLLSHKMHKKAPRRKDRSWRAADAENDVLPLVRGVSKPVSYGAARLSQDAI